MNKSYILTRYVKAIYYVCTSQFTCYVLTIQYWSRGKSPSIEKRRLRSLSLSLEIFPCKMLFLLWVPSTDEWWSSVAPVEVMTNCSQQPGITYQVTVVSYNQGLFLRVICENNFTSDSRYRGSLGDSSMRYNSGVFIWWKNMTYIHDWLSNTFPKH